MEWVWTQFRFIGKPTGVGEPARRRTFMAPAKTRSISGLEKGIVGQHVKVSGSTRAKLVEGPGQQEKKKKKKWGGEQAKRPFMGAQRARSMKLL